MIKCLFSTHECAHSQLVSYVSVFARSNEKKRFSPQHKGERIERNASDGKMPFDSKKCERRDSVKTSKWKGEIRDRKAIKEEEIAYYNCQILI